MLVVMKFIYKFSLSVIKNFFVKLINNKVYMYICFFKIEIIFRVKIIEFWVGFFGFLFFFRFWFYSFLLCCKFLDKFKMFFWFGILFSF